MPRWLARCRAAYPVHDRGSRVISAQGPHSRPSMTLLGQPSPTAGTSFARQRRVNNPHLASIEHHSPSEIVAALNRVIALERDMIAALLAARNRRPRAGAARIDELLVEHAERLPVLERRVRELGGQPIEPGRRPGELPRDACWIATVSDDRDVVGALVEDHEALGEAYLQTLAAAAIAAAVGAGAEREAYRMLELYTAEMEHQAASLTVLAGLRPALRASCELRQVA